MELRLLGPVTVLREGRVVGVRSRKALELLVVLLASPGLRASHDEIMHYLWPQEPLSPNRIRQTFHQLRKSVPEICSESNERGFVEFMSSRKRLITCASVDYCGRRTPHATPRSGSIHFATRQGSGAGFFSMGCKGSLSIGDGMN